MALASSSPAESAWQNLVEVDRLLVMSIIDNETDGISSSCGCCNPLNPNHVAKYTGEFSRKIQEAAEVDISKLMFAAHGLSLCLVAERDGKRHTLLIDAGPNEELWKMNFEKWHITAHEVEAAVLTHWHPDHSRGLSAAAAVVGPARAAHPNLQPLIFDLHPDRPVCRGMRLSDGSYRAFNQDVEFNELTQVGCTVQLHSDPHTLLDDFFYVSGAVPRLTAYEKGLPSHVTQTTAGDWVNDPEILDERYVAVRVRGRGTVVFSACSHAGIVNVCRDVKALSNEPLLAVVGGFHLAGRECEPRIPETVADLRELSPSMVLAGHCTGWAAKHALATAFQDRFQPLVVGGLYEFQSLP